MDILVILKKSKLGVCESDTAYLKRQFIQNLKF